MLRAYGLAGLLIVLLSSSGCRCCSAFWCYADAIDEINDHGNCGLFDQCYNPRLDISRAGRPDWCGPVNRWLCPCRCYMGCWHRFDECHLYPPRYAYQYPAEFFGTNVGGFEPVPRAEETAPPSTMEAPVNPAEELPAAPLAPPEQDAAQPLPKAIEQRVEPSNPPAPQQESVPPVIPEAPIPEAKKPRSIL